MKVKELIEMLKEVPEDLQDYDISISVKGTATGTAEVVTRSYFSNDHGYDYDTEDQDVDVCLDDETDEIELIVKEDAVCIEAYL